MDEAFFLCAAITVLVMIFATVFGVLPWGEEELEESATAWRTLGRLFRHWWGR